MMQIFPNSLSALALVFILIVSATVNLVYAAPVDYKISYVGGCKETKITDGLKCGKHIRYLK
jgi:hypothetical protein